MGDRKEDLDGLEDDGNPFVAAAAIGVVWAAILLAVAAWVWGGP